MCNIPYTRQLFEVRYVQHLGAETSVTSNALISEICYVFNKLRHWKRVGGCMG